MLTVRVESPPAPMGCRSCGVVAHSHGRREVVLVDAPCFDRPVKLVWRKRTWRCGEPSCPVGAFTEPDEQIARPRSDFFDVRPYATLISLPRSITARGLGKAQQRDVQIPLLDAVVGNPPYVSQENISKPHKERYQEIARKNGANLSKRSDIHCYFWPHSLSFLKEDGHLCYITSSQWLDTDYGFKLQDWILRHFEVVALFESLIEPWFVGARVVTTVTILRRQPDAKKRMDNIVRFVQLRKPMAEILAHDGTTAGAVSAANRFRNELLNLTEDTINARYRVRLVRQGDLWMEGVHLGVTMNKNQPVDANDPKPQPGEYYGGKWGIQLRAPDLWFDLLDRFDARMVPLVEIAEVDRGITSGKDNFFFPKDATDEALEKFADPMAFATQFGAERDEVGSGEVKIVHCGEGYEEMRPIEKRFLEPEVHSLMDLNNYVVRQEDSSRLVVLIPSNRDALDGPYAARYIEWGEEQNFHLAPTLRGRATREREWFDLTNSPRMSVIVPKIQQYRLFTLLNEPRYYQASALLGLTDMGGVDAEVMAGVLNSTLSVLSRVLYARVRGNEGNIQLDVYSAEMMRVPDPRLATDTQRQRITDAFNAMKERSALGFLSERRLRRMTYVAKDEEAELAQLSDETELTQLDRRELDDAVLEVLGITSAQERAKFLDDLYAYLTDFFEWTRQKEEEAIKNKIKAKGRKRVLPSDLASEIFALVEREHGTILRAYSDFVDLTKPFDTYEIPANGHPEPVDGLLDRHAIRFFVNKSTEAPIIETRSDAQRDLLLLLVQNGVRGFIRVPLEVEASLNLRERYARFLKQRADRLRALIEERTADPDLQEKVYADLLRRVQGPRG